MSNLEREKVLSSCFSRQATDRASLPYYMMVCMALWDRWTDALRVLHPSHDAPRSLFARAKPAPGDEAGISRESWMGWKVVKIWKSCLSFSWAVICWVSGSHDVPLLSNWVFSLSLNVILLSQSKLSWKTMSCKIKWIDCFTSVLDPIPPSLQVFG